MNVWVVLPTYNESENLPIMVEALLRLDLVPPSRSLGASHAVGPTHAERAAGPGPAERITARVTSSGSSSAAASGLGGVSTISEPVATGNDHAMGNNHRSPGPDHEIGPTSGPTVSILVVDDNSPDGTGVIADGLACELPGRVQVIHRRRKLGLGSAYIQGFGFALSHGADAVVEMDADFSHSPEYLPTMISVLDRYDVVVGSRWVEGGGLDPRWERWRYLLSKYANVYARAVTGLEVQDTTAGFKAFRADALRRLPLHRVRSDGYAFQVEMATACQRLGLRVAELPIFFEERSRGRSKMSLRIILEAMWRVWQIRFRW